jgi:hypothetical protein
VYVPAEAAIVARLRIEEAEPPEANDNPTGFRNTVGPEGDTVAARFTLPVKPFWLDRVIVAFPDEPRMILSEEWSDMMAKSGFTTITERLAVWEFPAPEPVTETVYPPVPVEAPMLTLRFVVPGVVVLTETVEVVSVAVIPAGAVGAENVTVPENPFKLVTVIVEVCEDPWFMFRLDGFGVMLKSGDSTMNLPVMGPLWMKHQ